MKTLFFRTVFLNFGIVDIWGKIVLVCECCLLQFSSILVPLDINWNPFPLAIVISKNVSKAWVGM
jgi:hypothetical protein